MRPFSTNHIKKSNLFFDGKNRPPTDPRERLQNIELTTKLHLDSTADGIRGTINLLSMTYRAGEKGVNSMRVDEYLQKISGLNFSGSKECSDILLPKVNPGKIELLKSVLRRELTSIIKL